MDFDFSGVCILNVCLWVGCSVFDLVEVIGWIGLQGEHSFDMDGHEFGVSNCYEFFCLSCCNCERDAFVFKGEESSATYVVWFVVLM